MAHRHAIGAITLIILTLARLTAIMGRAGSPAASLSAPDPGTAGVGAVGTVGAVAAAMDIEAATATAADTADTERGPDTEPVGLDTAAHGPEWADDLDMAAEPVPEALVTRVLLAASMAAAVAEVDSTAVAAATVAVDTGKLN